MKKDNIRYAGFWIRTLAVVIDQIILLIPSLVLSNLLALRGILNNNYIEIGRDFFFQFVVLWTYYSLQLSYGWQATLGMKFLKIKIINEQEENISLYQATIRFLGVFLSAILLFIGFFMVAFDKKKQGLHDKIAKTLVIYS